MDPWDNMKNNDICIRVVLEKRKQGIENLFVEIITEGFPILVEKRHMS